MHALKYKGYAPVLEKAMASLTASLLDGNERFEGVVPVPLRRARLAKRGFNQVAWGWPARAAERINAPVLDKLKVVHRTRDQVELSAEARRTNAAGAYPSTGFVAGRILLVDDRLAAGATLSGCAEALRRAGGGEAEALTQYRTCRGVFKSLSSSADQEN